MKRLVSLLAFCFCWTSFVPLGCDSATTCAVHEDCEADELCIFTTGRCGAKCDPAAASACPGDGTCDQCATSSCPGCRDCAAACVQPVSESGGW